MSIERTMPSSTIERRSYGSMTRASFSVVWALLGTTESLGTGDGCPPETVSTHENRATRARFSREERLLLPRSIGAELLRARHLSRRPGLSDQMRSRTRCTAGSTRCLYTGSTRSRALRACPISWSVTCRRTSPPLASAFSISELSRLRSASISLVRAFGSRRVLTRFCSVSSSRARVSEFRQVSAVSRTFSATVGPSRSTRRRPAAPAPTAYGRWPARSVRSSIVSWAWWWWSYGPCRLLDPFSLLASFLLALSLFGIIPEQTFGEHMFLPRHQSGLHRFAEFPGMKRAASGRAQANDACPRLLARPSDRAHRAPPGAAARPGRSRRG